MSNTLNITMDQGSSLTYVFTLQDELAAPYSLVGYTASLQVRRFYGDATPLVNATMANSKILITNAAGGELTLELLPADTSGIRFNSTNDDTLECVYDLEIVSAAGKVYKPARGTFTLNREVTR